MANLTQGRRQWSNNALAVTMEAMAVDKIRRNGHYTTFADKEFLRNDLLERVSISRLFLERRHLAWFSKTSSRIRQPRGDEHPICRTRHIWPHSLLTVQLPPPSRLPVLGDSGVTRHPSKLKITSSHSCTLEDSAANHSSSLNFFFHLSLTLVCSPASFDKEMSGEIGGREQRLVQPSVHRRTSDTS